MSVCAEVLPGSPIFHRDYMLGKVICEDARRKLKEVDALLDEAAAAVETATYQQLKEIRKVVDHLSAMAREMNIERTLAMASEKQVAYIGAFFGTPWYCLSVMGGNQGGKTYIAAVCFCMWLRDVAPANGIVWCIAPTAEKSVGTQQKYLWEILPKRYLGDAVWDEKNGFGSKNPILVFDPHGKRVTIKFKTQSQYQSDPSSFESETINHIWVDEWVSADAWAALHPRLVVKKGRIQNSTILSPDYDCGWMYESIWMASDPEEFRLYVMTPKDNPTIDAQSIRRMYSAIQDEDQRRLRIEGRPIIAGSFVYQEFDEKRHVVPLSSFPKDLTWYAGMDVGMDHPTVWLMVGVDKQGRYWVAPEYTSRNTPTDVDASRILSMLKEGVNGEKNIQLEDDTYIDKAAFQVNKSNQLSVGDQYAQYGLPVSPSLCTRQVGEWNQIHQIKMLLKDNRLFLCEECYLLTRNFKLWKFKRDRQGKPIGSDSFEDKNNDALDALRYVLTMDLVYKEPQYRRKNALAGYSAEPLYA